MPLLAKSRDEVHGDVLAVDVAIEVEDQHFEQRRAAADRRPRADARDARERLRAETAHARGEHAVDGREPALEIHVRSREPELAAEPEPAHDAARDGVIAAEHSARGFEIADSERLPNRR